MKRSRKLDSYHWHEALDRASLAVEWFEQFVGQHPAVRQTPSLRKAADDLAHRLFKFYQAVAVADLSNKKP